MSKDRTFNILMGSILVLAGFFLLLSSLKLIDIGSIWEYLPLVLVIIGISKLIGGDSKHSVRSGVWFIFLGVFLFASINYSFGYGLSDTWPILVLAFGLNLIWEALINQLAARKTEEVVHGS
jgi:uncharacterized membrane protein YecN with MAPEG domain